MADQWDGVERRQVDRRTNDVVSEFAAFRVAMDRMADAVTNAFPEKRIREFIAYEQNRSRWRTVAYILFPVMIALGVVFSQAKSNEGTLREAKVTADFVRDCLQHPERLTAEQRVARCGGTADNGTAKAVQALIEANKCFLLILPAERTNENMDACVVRTIESLRGGG